LVSEKYLRKSAKKSAKICGKALLNAEAVYSAEVFPEESQIPKFPNSQIPHFLSFP
jgi:hypothetical protein